MYFFFAFKTFVRLLSHYSIPYVENQYHFYHFFAFTFTKPFTALFPFVSNGDSLDWRGLTCEQMLERIIPKTKSGDILLFHNDTAHTAESLDRILTELEGKGFSFLKVSDLIYKDNYTIDHTGKQIKS